MSNLSVKAEKFGMLAEAIEYHNRKAGQLQLLADAESHAPFSYKLYADSTKHRNIAEQIAALSRLQEGEPVGWATQDGIDFLEDGRKANRLSSLLVHCTPNELMGWTVPVFTTPPTQDSVAGWQDKVISSLRNCVHDGGYDREIGPIGCDLGDKCVCIGVANTVRALSNKEG